MALSRFLRTRWRFLSSAEIWGLEALRPPRRRFKGGDNNEDGMGCPLRTGVVIDDGTHGGDRTKAADTMGTVTAGLVDGSVVTSLVDKTVGGCGDGDGDDDDDDKVVATRGSSIDCGVGTLLLTGAWSSTAVVIGTFLSENSLQERCMDTCTFPEKTDNKYYRQSHEKR